MSKEVYVDVVFGDLILRVKELARLCKPRFVVHAGILDTEGLFVSYGFVAYADSFMGVVPLVEQAALAMDLSQGINIAMQFIRLIQSDKIPNPVEAQPSKLIVTFTVNDNPIKLYKVGDEFVARRADNSDAFTCSSPVKALEFILSNYYTAGV